MISQKLDKKADCYPKNELYSLIKVLGTASKNNYSFTSNSANGLISWIAGPYVIFYDIASDKQVGFLKNSNNKIISCVRFNKSGTQIATGEGNCRNGEICIYNVEFNSEKLEEKHEFFASFKVHKYGIDKLLFFKKDNLLLSIGNLMDRTMSIINIENRQVIISSRFNRPILCSDVCDDFLVLCGNGFIKIYNVEKLDCDSGEGLEKKQVDLSKLSDKTFVSCQIYEKVSPASIERKIFFLTFDCYLVEMKSTSLILNRWVHLKSAKGLALTIWDSCIGCGCADGVYRIFNADTLEHIVSLHRPPPLGAINEGKKDGKGNNQLIKYPDITATFFNHFHNKLVIVYSNKTFFVYDISDTNKTFIHRSRVFHSGSINAMHCFLDKGKNVLKIATCSDDKTAILWNFSGTFLEDKNEKNNGIDIQHILLSKEIRHVFFLDKNFDNFKINDVGFVLNHGNSGKGGGVDNEMNLTSIRFSPEGSFLCVGDNIGNIYVFSCENFTKVKEIPVHNAAINSIDMIKDEKRGKSYLATGSSDGLINVINITNGFDGDLDVNARVTEKMESPVIGLIFCIDKNSSLKLIVAEQNSTITFFYFSTSLVALQKYSDPRLKIYHMDISPQIKKVISGHNGKLTIWKTSTCVVHKHFQVNKGDKLLDNFRVACDSSGVLFATSNNDKIIRIRALHDGSLLSKIAVSESISALSFCLDDKLLVACSVEGYVYFYRMDQDYVKNLKKDNNLINSTEEKNIINNKLKLLQKFVENDNSLSKNEQVKYLLDKFQKSEEITIGDLNILDDFVEKNQKSDKGEDPNKNKKGESTIFEIKEEKPNNNDEAENENNNEEDVDEEHKERKDDNKVINLNKSQIFEKSLRENFKSQNTSSAIRKSDRFSLTDDYMKSLQNNKVPLPKIKIVGKEEHNSVNENEGNDESKQNKGGSGKEKEGKIETIEENLDENNISLSKGEKRMENNNNSNNNNNTNSNNYNNNNNNHHSNNTTNSNNYNNDNNNHSNIINDSNTERKKKIDNNDNNIITNECKDQGKINDGDNSNTDVNNNNICNEDDNFMTESRKNLVEIKNMIKDANKYIFKLASDVKDQEEVLSKSQSKEKGELNLEDIRLTPKETGEKNKQSFNNESNSNTEKRKSTVKNNKEIRESLTDNIDNKDNNENINLDPSSNPENNTSKFNNIKINEELGSPLENKTNNESKISEVIDVNESNIPPLSSEISYTNNFSQNNIIENSQKQAKECADSCTVTQTYLEINSQCCEINSCYKKEKGFEKCVKCGESKFTLTPSPKNKITFLVKQQQHLSLLKKDKSIKEKIHDIFSDFNKEKNVSKENLEEIEGELEAFLDAVRTKLGTNYPDPTMGKVLEKYSVLLMEKIKEKSGGN